MLKMFNIKFKKSKEKKADDVYNFLDAQSYANKYGNGFFHDKDLLMYCKSVGGENVRFLAPLVKLRNSQTDDIPKGVYYEQREDHKNLFYVECGIDETRFQRSVEDGYKFELYSVDAEDLFGTDDMYVMDLAGLIKDGHIKIIVSKKEEVGCEPSLVEQTLIEDLGLDKNNVEFYDNTYKRIKLQELAFKYRDDKTTLKKAWALQLNEEYYNVQRQLEEESNYDGSIDYAIDFLNYVKGHEYYERYAW